MRKRLLAIVLSVFMLANAGLSISAKNTSSNGNAPKGVSVEFQDLGEDFGKSPARKLSSKNTDEKQSIENEKVGFNDTDVVRVSIILEAEATLEKYSTENIAKNKKAVSYRNSLRNKQNKVVAAIEKKGIALEVKWNLTLAANMISVEVAYGEIEAIKNIDGVKDVILENRYEVAQDDVNTSVTTSEMIFAQYAWANGYTGAGSKVAIVDTGTNQDHISFDSEALEYSLTKDGKTLSDYNLLTKEGITAVLDQLNATQRRNDVSADNLYKNTKIPYAFNYVDKNYTTDHDSDTAGEHGSHVSGIAAANRYIKVDGQFVEAAGEVGAVGVAPDAQIITMKVFGAGGGAYDSDYMVAIEDAIILGADSVNLSLGSGMAGFAFSDGYQEILNKLTGSSTVVVMSAGNSYGWNDTSYGYTPDGYIYDDDVSFATAGSPGSFVDTMQVASADNIGKYTNPLVFNGEFSVVFNETSGYANPAIATVAGTYDYVYIDAQGQVADYEAVNAVVPLSGKVVMVNRGGISFYQKGDNCYEYNPVAVIVVNNQAGVINMDLSNLVNPIPMVSILQADGEALKADSQVTEVDEYTVFTGKVEITEKKSPAVQKNHYDATMSDFSSWGATGALLIKPEITAPGGAIWSVNGMTDDGYEDMSGTSMAAPHVTGMAALMAQYVKESGIDAKAGMSRRAVINALLMSTAYPLYEDGYYYYSVMKQGAGLANVYNATVAKSVVTVNEDATASYADGKVKVELGEDKERKGVYNYSFNIHNTSDKPIEYMLTSDFFTQYAVQGYLSKETDFALSYTDTYDVEIGFDVNKDGKTDTADVQAILDIVTGKAAAENKDYDLVIADVDRDGKITSYDAELLILYINLNVISVAPGEKKTVKVTIEIENKDVLDEEYVNGCYIEGYTTAVCISSDEEGEYDDVDYSFPVLGFYGSWTEPSMYDTSKAVEVCYGMVENYPYFGELITNYIGIKDNGSSGVRAFTGNPYDSEDEIPYDRFAISGDAQIANVTYQLIRSAVAVNPYVATVNEDGSIGSFVYNGKVDKNVIAPYYYVNGQAWQGVGSRTAKIGKTAHELGFNDGDKIEIGMVAIPEYYAMKANNNASNVLTQDQINAMITDGTLGEGAFIHYQMTVDSVAPEMIECVLDEEAKTVTVVAKDDRYIAYIGIMDMSGEEILAGGIPGQSEPGQQVSYTIDISDVDLGNACVVFIGDYAANEVYKVAILKEGPVYIKKAVYKLAETLEPGKEYIIADRRNAGEAHTLVSQDYGYYNKTVGTPTVCSDEMGTYIKLNDVSDEEIWTSEEVSGGCAFKAGNGYYLWAYNQGYPTVTYTTKSPFVYNYAAGTLQSGGYYIFYYATADYYLTYNASFGTTYLYTKDYIEQEIDPTVASKVEVTPSKTTLIMGVNESVQLSAEVAPVYLANRNVTWSSSNEDVATVDANGLVTATAIGSVVIRATSDNTPEVYGECQISVVTATPVDSSINAMINTAAGAQFVTVNLNNMNTTKLADAPTFLVGGGRGNDYVRGVDGSSEIWKFQISEGYAAEDCFTMIEKYAPLDCGNWFNIAGQTTGKEYNYETVGVTESGLFCIYDSETGVTYFDLSSLGITFIAVTFAGITTDQDGVNNWFYMLTNEGELYGFYIFVNEEDPDSVGLSGDLDVINTISGITISDNINDYSIAYDYVNEAIYVADSGLGAIYYVELDWSGEAVDATYCGKIEGATGISSLYNDDYDSISAVKGEKQEAVKHVAHFNAVNDECAVKKVEEVKAEAEEAVGTTDSIKDYTVNVKPVVGVTNNAVAPIAVAPNNLIATFGDGEAANTITYSTEEYEVIFNGKIVATYDPANAEFVNASDNCQFSSVYDDGNGTVTFAFAGITPMYGKVVTFEFYGGCEDSAASVAVKEADDELDLNEVTEGTIRGIGHDYQLAGFEWNENHTACKANFVCQNNPEHNFQLDCEIDDQVVEEPTTEKEGLRVVTAKVVYGEIEYQDVYQEILPVVIPDTGDHSMAKLWLSLSAITLAGGAVVLLKKRED